MDKRRGACITIFCQRFCLTVPKKFVGQPFCVSEKKQVSKKFTNKKEISFFCANNFLSHRVQKFRRGISLSFRNLRVSKNVMDKRRGGCITILCQSFVSQSRKLSQGNPCVFLKKIDYRKILRIRRGYCLLVLLIFCPTEPKGFVGEHVCVSGKSVYRKFFGWETRGVYHDFLSKSLSHSTEKFRRGTLFCFRKFRVSKHFLHRKGISLNSVGNLFFRSAEKFCRWSLLCFEKLLASKKF